MKKKAEDDNYKAVKDRGYRQFKDLNNQIFKLVIVNMDQYTISNWTYFNNWVETD